jgi:hypothetical protein
VAAEKDKAVNIPDEGADIADPAGESTTDLGGFGHLSEVKTDLAFSEKEFEIVAESLQTDVHPFFRKTSGSDFNDSEGGLKVTENSKTKKNLSLNIPAVGRDADEETKLLE